MADIQVNFQANAKGLLDAIGKATSKLRGFGSAVNKEALPATAKFAEMQKTLAGLGIKTVSSLEGQIATLKQLKTEFGSDARAAAQLDSKLESLRTELDALFNATTKPIPAFNALSNAQSTLARLGVVTGDSVRRQIQQLEQLKKTFQGDAVVVEQLNSKIARLNGSMGGSRGGGGLTRTTSQATTTLTNFNRVVQDAPFGILGIANNIDPLLESFQRLRQQTGSTGATIKLLASTFFGPIGILTAVSAATSLFVAFGPKIKEAFGKGKKAAEEAKEAFDDAIGSVVEFNLTKGAQFEVKSAKDLLAILKGAKKEVNALEKAIDKFDAQIIKGPISTTGRASEFRTRVKISNEARLLKSRAEEQLALQKAIVEKLEDQKKGLEAQVSIAQQLAALGTKRKIEVPEIGPEIPDPVSISAFGERNIEKVFSLPKSKFDVFDSNQESELDKVITKLAVVRKGIEEGILTPTEGARREFALLQQQLLILAGNGVVGLEPLKAKLEELRSEINSNNKELNITGELFAELAGGAAGAIADMVLGFEDLKGVLNSVKGLLRGIVRDIATAAAKAAIFNLILPGSEAAGGGFKGLFGGFLGLASGGIVTKPTTALIGEAGPEAVIPLDKLNGFGKVQLEGTMVRFDGSQFLVDFRQAQNTRGVGF